MVMRFFVFYNLPHSSKNVCFFYRQSLVRGVKYRQKLVRKTARIPGKGAGRFSCAKLQKSLCGGDQSALDRVGVACGAFVTVNHFFVCFAHVFVCFLTIAGGQPSLFLAGKQVETF